MNKSSLIFAMLLASFTFNTRAVGTYIGVDASYTRYPEWGDRISSNAYASGASYAITNEHSMGIGLGIRGGQWKNDNFGWEAGYDNLRSNDGSTNILTGGNNGFGSFKYSATAIHAAALGGVKFNKSTLFGKIGVHSHTTQLNGVTVFGGSAYSKTASGTGLLLGIGYISTYTNKLSGRYAIDLFRGVVFTDILDFSQTTQENLVKFSYGLDYAF